MKIYTRTGDGGATTLFDGTRIAKSDPRVDAYGEVDEANAAVGVARASGVDHDIEDMLGQIQRDLFALGSRLADYVDQCGVEEAEQAITGPPTHLWMRRR